MDTINKTQIANPVEQSQSVGASEDIVSRVMGASTQAVTPSGTKPAITGMESKIESLGESINSGLLKQEELAKIKDPYARQMLESAHKNMVSGMNEKFREIAELRKSLEQTKQQPQKPQYDITTKEGLQRALNDPSFANLVQQVAQEQAPSNWEGSQNEWSVLTDQEKQVFTQMQNQMRSMSKTLSEFEKRDVDSRIKSKFPDYTPDVVDDFERSLTSGEITEEQRRELIFKALKHEDHIRRAYDIAKQEVSGIVNQKLHATSIDSNLNSQVTNIGIPERGTKNSASHFKEIAEGLLAKAKDRIAS